MRELVAIAETYDAVLISDDGCTTTTTSRGRSPARSRPISAHRIVTNAFSKSMAITGARVGYAIFPPELVANAKSRHMLVNVATTRPGQFAVLQALRARRSRPTTSATESGSASASRRSPTRSRLRRGVHHAEGIVST